MSDTRQLPEEYPAARRGRHRQARRMPKLRVPRFLARIVEARRQRLDREADGMVGDILRRDWSDEATWEWREVGLRM